MLLQIALYTDIPEQARVSASEVLDTALAYIAHGFATQQPALVQRADELLSRVAAAAQVCFYGVNGPGWAGLMPTVGSCHSCQCHQSLLLMHGPTCVCADWHVC